jgi:hypothetical protein
MVAGAIDWNICPLVLGMTKGSIARGQDQRENVPVLLHLGIGHLRHKQQWLHMKRTGSVRMLYLLKAKEMYAE